MKLIVFAATAVLLATSAGSQHAHGAKGIIETGQSQFAAIAEIVALLRADEDTDWGSVRIDALRDHLIDMENVTTRSAVENSIDGLTVTFKVTGNLAVAPSIQRMVSAHASMLHASTGWKVTSQSMSSGAKMVITAHTAEQIEEITGLGFFGVMTVGAHHQRHHLMIAMGKLSH